MASEIGPLASGQYNFMNSDESLRQKQQQDLISQGFHPLCETDEPLSDEHFQQLPGNLKKSYLMMEIQEDKLQ